MGKRLTCLCLVVLASVHVSAQRSGFLLFTDPGQRFSIEFPENWKWMIVSGSGEPIATFTHPRSEAAVVVEPSRLRQRLNPEDITDLFAEIEAEYLKEHQRGVINVVARVMTQNGVRAAVIDYNRPGLKEQERVRMYSFPVGEDLYRVTCMALASRFERYVTDFESIVATLRSSDKLR